MQKELEELLEIVLPREFLKYFEVIKVRQDKGKIEILAEEKNNPPEVEGIVQSKGLLLEKELRDFPIRGKPCVLRVKRRKWVVEGEKGILKRQLKLTLDGTKLETDFALFFEGRD